MLGGVDLHLHSSASDGTDTPGELLTAVRESGLNLIALTDHDTIAGVAQMEKIIPKDITFLRGIEFSCKARRGKCHILGFAYDPANVEFRQALELGAALRRRKLERRLAFLQEEVGVPFTDADLEGLRRMSSVGKPHLANLMVEKGFAHSKEDAIENYIDHCATGESRIDAGTAVRAILAAGGIPVWAHPLGGSRDIPEAQFHEILGELVGYGLQGLECYYSRYGLQRAEWLADIARQNALWISGGSDYHGENKKGIALGMLNSEGVEVPAERLSILQAIMEKRG